MVLFKRKIRFSNTFPLNIIITIDISENYEEK